MLAAIKPTICGQATITLSHSGQRRAYDCALQLAQIERSERAGGRIQQRQYGLAIECGRRQARQYLRGYDQRLLAVSRNYGLGNSWRQRWPYQGYVVGQVN